MCGRLKLPADSDYHPSRTDTDARLLAGSDAIQRVRQVFPFPTMTGTIGSESVRK